MISWLHRTHRDYFGCDAPAWWTVWVLLCGVMPWSFFWERR